MKKPVKILLISIGIIVMLGIIGRFTGALQSYRTPTASMEPTLKPGSNFFVSNLRKPKRYDIITFTRVLTEKDRFDKAGKKLTFTYRLIAFGGETLEIKNGYAWVNGQMVDDSTRLKFYYIMNKEDGIRLVPELGIDINSPSSPEFMDFSPKDSLVLNLSYDQYQIARRSAPVILYTADFGANEMYENDISKNWTVNNYGPIRIPPDCYFVLGDNRNCAADSRFVGPIPKKNLKGVILWK
jgi:signal peptidase I